MEKVNVQEAQFRCMTAELQRLHTLVVKHGATSALQVKRREDGVVVKELDLQYIGVASRLMNVISTYYDC